VAHLVNAFLAYLPLIVLGLVLSLIVAQQLFALPLAIWQIMCAGALLVLLTGRLSFSAAVAAIDWNLMFYLLGIFVVMAALELSGLLVRLLGFFLRYTSRPKAILFFIVFVLGPSSAFVMNDSMAIIGALLVLMITRQNRALSEPFFLALAYSITVGSLLTPVGNPQNILIATHSAMAQPFVVFFKSFFVPCCLSLAAIYALIAFLYRKALCCALNPPCLHSVSSARLRYSTFASLIVFFLLMGVKIYLSATQVTYQVPFAVVALLSAVPVLVGAPHRRALLSRVDWQTLLLFLGMFIVMASVSSAGVLQRLALSHQHLLHHKGFVLVSSLLLSQFFSNVPLVAAYAPLLSHASQSVWLALAAGSTLAGNVLTIGAASNLIILQLATKHRRQAFRFSVFVALGVLLSVATGLLFWFFLP
jgi:Na+/H+ antiporter NhaD/arsenite permease-like protein